MPLRLPCALLLLGYGAPALAHDPLLGTTGERLAGLVTALLLFAFWGAYALGSLRRPASGLRTVIFHATGVLAAIVLLGPLDAWAKTGTGAHMTQHMLLMVVIAPLWVLSRPLPQIAAGAGRIGAVLWAPMLRLASHPLWAVNLHGALVWAWHLPAFYMLAHDHPGWHALEHACFLVSAGVFWWAVLRPTMARMPWALLALLLIVIYTGFLGAVLTFARAPLYAEARDIQDQQLAGLIMWVPGAVPYLLAATWLVWRWYRQMAVEQGS